MSGRSPLSRRFYGDLKWIGFVNVSGEEIPARSIVMAQQWIQPDGSAAGVDSPSIQAVQPTDPINPTSCFITDNVRVQPGAFGRCARPAENLPLLLKIDDSDAGTNDGPGALCGPSEGSWFGTRGSDGFQMLTAPQNGYALVVPSEQRPQFFLTTTASSGDTYPKMSTQPTVYFARKVLSLSFDQEVGQQEADGTVDPNTDYYVYCDFTYLFQNTVVTAVSGIVTGIITGSRFELGMVGTLDTLLSSGGSTTVSVKYTDSLGNDVNDNIPVIEGLGLPSGSSLASGTRVFIEWDTSLYQWVVVATACGTSSSDSSDKPVSKPRPKDNLKPYSPKDNLKPYTYNPWA